MDEAKIDTTGWVPGRKVPDYSELTTHQARAEWARMVTAGDTDGSSARALLLAHPLVIKEKGK